MGKIENYSGLAKKQEDLLKVHYCVGTLGLVTMKTVFDNLTFNFRGSHLNSDSGTSVLASAWLQYQHKQVTVKAKRRSDALGYYSLEWVPENLVKNAKLKTDCKVYQKDGEQTVEATSTAEYNHEKCRAKLAFAYFPQQVKLSLTTGKPEMGLG